MKSKEYIILTIDSLLDRFTDFSCVYGYDPYSNSHFMKIPSLFHSDNDTFIKSETEIILDFITRYPYETITFITDEGIIENEDIVYSKSNIDSTSLNQIKFDFESSELFKSYFENISNVFKVNQIGSRRLLNFNPSLFYIANFQLSNSILPIDPTPIGCSKQGEFVTNDSDNEFALAA